MLGRRRASVNLGALWHSTDRELRRRAHSLSLSIVTDWRRGAAWRHLNGRGRTFAPRSTADLQFDPKLLVFPVGRVQPDQKVDERSSRRLRAPQKRILGTTKDAV